MKILLIGPVPPDLGSHNTGGIARHVWSLAVKLSQKGHDVAIMAIGRYNERRPVKLLSYHLADKQWSVDHVFNDIRHIHGVFRDRLSSKLWITTGDLDHESKILTLDNAGKFDEIAGGSQQYRVVDLVFSENYIFFATDAPEEINYIYRLDREQRNTEKLCRVGGPVFWGRSDGDWLFFSTVVESSSINREDAVELWGSDDEG